MKNSEYIMAKEIDVGASQMGVEILTNKGSEENPTKSIEIQKPPETFINHRPFKND